MSTHGFSSIGNRLRLESPHSGGFKKQPKPIFEQEFHSNLPEIERI